MNNRTYVIVDSSEVVNFDFDQLIDISEAESRKSLDGSKILARFVGETPSFLEDETHYNQSDMLVILSGDEWSSDII